MDYSPFLPLFIMLLAAPVFIYAAVKQNKLAKKIRNELFKDGYSVVFYGAGSSYIAFNIKESSFRAGSLIKYGYLQEPISYIHNYEWKWNVIDGRKTENIFFIYISNIDYPVHKIFYHRKEHLAEIEWAKLQAVFHQSYEPHDKKMKKNNEVHFDFFISHASEDKDILVRPLVNELSRLGVNIWFDEQTLEVGDSLRRNIDAGLKKASYGIVILSHAFFNKRWTQYELDSLINRAVNDENKVLLPVWHNIDASEVAKYSHYLADKVALQTNMYTINEIARELSRIAYKHREGLPRA